jgi:hypothetical protein
VLSWSAAAIAIAARTAGAAAELGTGKLAIEQGAGPNGNKQHRISLDTGAFILFLPQLRYY